METVITRKGVDKMENEGTEAEVAVLLIDRARVRVRVQHNTFSLAAAHLSLVPRPLCHFITSSTPFFI